MQWVHKMDLVNTQIKELVSPLIKLGVVLVLVRLGYVLQVKSGSFQAMGQLLVPPQEEGPKARSFLLFYFSLLFLTSLT